MDDQSRFEARDEKGILSMLRTHMAACLLATSLAAVPAFAQSSGANPSAGGQAGAAQSSNIQFVQARPDMWRAGDLDGIDVYNDRNEKIGDISDVIVDRSGKVEAVIIGVGGFLGIGQRNVGVPFNALRFEMNNDNASGAAANRSAAAANNNAGGVPRDNAVGSAATTASGSAGNTGAGAAGASRGASAGSTAATSSTNAGNTASSNNMKPQRAVLAGATKEQLQNAPQWSSNDRGSNRGAGGSGGNESGGANRR